MLLYAITIFLSAFLLFQVQPLIGKYILPWFGGTPGVWTTCLLFFQILLLAGYAYAHLIVGRLNPRKQAWVHGLLLLAAMLALPIAPAEAWKPTGEENPLWRILGLLTVSIGAPYLLLSSTGPLIQGWFSRSYPTLSPYRLYALSNIGSLLALLSYPILVERYFRLPLQAAIWSVGFVFFVALCIACAVQLVRLAPVVQPVTDARDAEVRRPPWGHLLLWLLLAGCGTTMLMATTNQICQEVAVVPFLWVLPLSLYLLTFIICFDREAWYHRVLFAMLFTIFCAVEVWMLTENTGTLAQQIGVFAITMFCSCMICHGEMVKLKPAPRYLTLFYLMVSAGGALGGLFVAIAAPRIFSGFWELHTGLCLTVALLLVVAGLEWLRDRPERAQESSSSRLVSYATGGTALAGLVFLVYLLHDQTQDMLLKAVETRRNFYGIIRVLDEYERDPEQRQLTMVHGRTRHGFQYQDPAKRDWSTSYYSRTSGIGLALSDHPARYRYGRDDLRIGTIGLGTGTAVTYARDGDWFRFYEINPAVVELAENTFSYLADARRRGAQVDVKLGDARIVLERMLKNGENQQFDVLAVDAFSSDAIPIHLLTRECFEIYFQHLRPDGILVINITNQYLDLSPVVRGLGEAMERRVALVKASGDPSLGTYNSTWMLVSNNEAFWQQPLVQQAITPWPDERRIVWTDNFSNLLQVLKE